MRRQAAEPPENCTPVSLTIIVRARDDGAGRPEPYLLGFDCPRWRHTETKVIQLIELSPAVIHALAGGDLATANHSAPVKLTQYLVTPEWRRTWRLRSRQVDSDPTTAEWITRAIFDPDRQIAVGAAGYHGPPDHLGMVEVGYSVDPTYRRQGYARAALLALLRRAEREPSIRAVRATIRPDNEASRRLVLQYGFVEVGEQWDDEDGLETIFEVTSKRGDEGPHPCLLRTSQERG
jgi:ribosomal-protein-alanine N-acetyltransferase